MLAYLPRSILCQATCIAQRRNLFWLLNAAVNKLDHDRIKMYGPDQSCAEWLVKCGAEIKFYNEKPVKDYKQLNLSGSRSSKLAEVYAEKAIVMDIGFPHFAGVNHLEKMTFKQCGRFDDSCIHYIVKHLSGSLKDLEIISCDVSDKGLHKISQLKLLERLRLFELPGVKKKEECFKMLVEHLPKCKISFEDHNGFCMTTETAV